MNQAILTRPYRKLLKIDLSEPSAALRTHLQLANLLDKDASTISNLVQINEVHIEGRLGHGNFSLIQQVLDSLQNLDKVVWDYEDQISLLFLRSLEKYNPSCKLYYRLPYRDWISTFTYELPDFGAEKLPLKYAVWPPEWDEGDSFYKWTPDPAVDEALFASPILYAIKGHMDDGLYDYSYFMTFIFNALRENRNIRELSLRTWKWGCEARGEFRAFDFASYPDTRLTPLEVLRLDGYGLGANANGGDDWDFVRRGRARWMPNNAFRGMRHHETTSPGAQHTIWEQVKDWISSRMRGTHHHNRMESNHNYTNLDAWMQAMDWSHIHTLEVGPESDKTLSRLMGHALPALKDLTISESGMSETGVFYDFLTHTAQPLEALTLWATPSVGNHVVSIFASSPALLQELRRFSFAAGYENVRFISSANIKALLNAAPRLEELDLNVPRQQLSVHAEPFTSFLLSPTLQHLILRFPSPDQPTTTISGELIELDQLWKSLPTFAWLVFDANDDPDPYITRDSVLRLFRDMRREKHGAELATLDIVVGAWDVSDRYNHANVRARVAKWECYVEDGKESCTGCQRTTGKGSTRAC